MDKSQAEMVNIARLFMDAVFASIREQRSTRINMTIPAFGGMPERMAIVAVQAKVETKE